MIKSKNILFLLFLGLFFIIFNSGIFINWFFSSSDELVLAMSILLVLINIAKGLKSDQIKKLYIALIIYVLYQLLNTLISIFDGKLYLSLLQSLINIKVFLISYAILLVWDNSYVQRVLLQKIYFAMIGLFVIGLTGNFLLQEKWNYLLGAAEIHYRYGFISPVGWFGAKGQNLYFFSLTFTTLFLIYSKKPLIESKIFVKKFFIFTIIDFLMAFPLAGRKGMMMVLPFGYIALNQLKGQKKAIFFIVGLTFILSFLFLIKDMNIMQDTLQNFQSMTTDKDNSYIRGLMIYYGYSLFIEFFPFGTGAATFGTVLSAYNTLSVYEYVNLPISRIYQDGILEGVFDSGLFSMLAENGFIGIVLMFMFIFYFFKFNKKRLDEYNYLIFKIITWFAILLSFTEPVWQNGMFTVFYTMNLLFIYSKNNIYRVNKKWVYINPNEVKNENSPNL